MKNIVLTLTLAVGLTIPFLRLRGQEVEDIVRKAAPGAADFATQSPKEFENPAQPFGVLTEPNWVNYHAVGNQFGNRSGSHPLIIRSSEPDPKDQAQLEEDLRVMLHLLDKSVDNKISRDRYNTALGINLYFQPGANPSRAIYLEDYGALFLLRVPFPLVAPAKPEPEQEKAPTNSTWEQARREVYGEPNPYRAAPGPRVEEFDQEKVDNLKDSLIDALKNAGNIRGLKTDDNITITVLGSGGSGPRFITKIAKPGSGAKGQAFGATVARGSTLTLRVRKSDVDAFARNKLSPEEFRKKVHWATYVSAGEGPGETTVGLWGYPQGEDLDAVTR